MTQKLLKEIPDEVLEPMIEELKLLKSRLLELDDQSFDHMTHQWINEWDETPTAFQLLYLLDQCVHGSLCSAVVITILDAFLSVAAKRDNVTEEQLLEFASSYRK